LCSYIGNSCLGQMRLFVSILRHAKATLNK
jgi:hypothetical protein